MTAGGQAVNPVQMRPKDVRLEDIARALSNTCRWGGHLPDGVWISVAQHSVWVMRLLEYIGIDDPETLAQGLLHDASEAYVGDMVSPLKAQMPFYQQVEEHVQRTVACAFMIDYPWAPIVGWADKAAMVVIEAERAGKTPVDEVFSGLLENATTRLVWDTCSWPRGLGAFLGDQWHLWAGPREAYLKFMSAAQSLGLS